MQVKGVSDHSLAVRPDETLPIALTVGDDVGVAAASLEYRINQGKVQTETIELKGKGSREARAELGFKLVGKVKEGDTFEYRLVARDNRDVPAIPVVEQAQCDLRVQCGTAEPPRRSGSLAASVKPCPSRVLALPGLPTVTGASAHRHPDDGPGRSSHWYSARGWSCLWSYLRVQTARRSIWMWPEVLSDGSP